MTYVIAIGVIMLLAALGLLPWRRSVPLGAGASAASGALYAVFPGHAEIVALPVAMMAAAVASLHWRRWRGTEGRFMPWRPNPIWLTIMLVYMAAWAALDPGAWRLTLGFAVALGYAIVVFLVLGDSGPMHPRDRR